MQRQKGRVMVVCGVAGSGKSTLCQALHQAYAGRSVFVEGDDFHSPESQFKMHQGTPLTDQDRYPWLLSLRSHLERVQTDVDMVFASCSALKREYRCFLSYTIPEMMFVYLKCGEDVVRQRLKERQGHFVTNALAQSQLETLQVPVTQHALERCPVHQRQWHVMSLACDTTVNHMIQLVFNHMSITSQFSVDEIR